MFAKNARHLKQLEDASFVTRLSELARRVAADEKHISLQYAKEKGWIVVPIPDELTHCDAERIAGSAVATSVDRAYAVPLYTPPKHPELAQVLAVPMRRDAIMELAYEASFLPYLLIPEHGEFSMLLPGDDYALIGGTWPFVLDAVGSSIETARITFVDEWTSADTHPTWRENMMNVWNSYSELIDCMAGETPDKHTQPISEIEMGHAHSIVELTRQIVEDERNLNLKRLKLKDWSVVPAGGTIHAKNAEWIAAAAREIGIHSAFAVPLGSLWNSTGKVELCRVPMDREAIVKNEILFRSRSYALLPETGDFVVLRTVDEYCLIAGPSNFVEAAIRCSYESAELTFTKNWVELDSRPQWREEMLAVWDRYKDFAKL